MSLVTSLTAKQWRIYLAKINGEFSVAQAYEWRVRRNHYNWLMVLGLEETANTIYG